MNRAYLVVVLLVICRAVPAHAAPPPCRDASRWQSLFSFDSQPALESALDSKLAAPRVAPLRRRDDVALLAIVGAGVALAKWNRYGRRHLGASLAEGRKATIRGAQPVHEPDGAAILPSDTSFVEIIEAILNHAVEPIRRPPNQFWHDARGPPGADAKLDVAVMKLL